MLLYGEVKCRSDTSHHVRTVVVEAFTRILHINRNRDVGRFYGLKLLLFVQFVAESEVLSAKVHGWNHTQCQTLCQIKLAQYSDRESRLIVGCFCKPLRTIPINISILLQLDVL